jgi:hypothetical protein
VGPAPALGEHLGEVLRDWLDWGPDEVARFRSPPARGEA